MPDPAHEPDKRPDPDDEPDSAPAGDADARNAEDEDTERAKRIYDAVGADNPDPITRREAIEGELEEEGLSEAGGTLGEHNE